MENLPVVLLGIRATVKADLGCSAAESVFRSTLRLPVQFVAPTNIHTDLDPRNYVDRLRRPMSELHYIPIRAQQSSTHLPKDLLSCIHVFVRDDTVRVSLQPPSLPGPLPSHYQEGQILHP